MTNKEHIQKPELQANNSITINHARIFTAAESRDLGALNTNTTEMSPITKEIQQIGLNAMESIAASMKRFHELAGWSWCPRMSLYDESEEWLHGGRLLFFPQGMASGRAFTEMFEIGQAERKDMIRRIEVYADGWEKVECGIR